MLNAEPFVKWAGGKKQILGKLISRMPVSYKKYFEPFIGGGALLFGVQPTEAVINDINPQLINVYRCLMDNIEAVISTVNKFDMELCDKEHYLNMRNRFNDKIKSCTLDVESAALMIWINKHCFNGLYRVNSKGIFNVPWNNKSAGKSINEKNLRNIGQYLNTFKIKIRQGDFENACADVEKGDFVYFDPPYIPASSTANFTDYSKLGFDLEDHKRLAILFRKLDSIGAMVMLSNSNVPLVHELYAGYNIESLNVRRSINSDASKRVGKEVIITNFNRDLIE